MNSSNHPDNNTSKIYLLALVLLAIAATLASTVQLNGIDFWLQAKVGELIAHDHAIPKTLLFPFTEVAEDPFHAHEWLASLLFHYELQWLGEDYMPLLIGLHGTILFLLAARLGYLRSRGGSAQALTAGCLTILLENYRHVMRPELPAILIMASFWWCLESFHQRPRWLPAISATLLMVIWTNMHGSFVLAVVLVGIYTFNSLLAFQRMRDRATAESCTRWIALLGAILFSTLLNPEGLGLWRFVLEFGTNNSNKVLTEWYPTLDNRLTSLPGLWIILTGWLATIGLCCWRWRRLSPIDILLIVAFSVLFFRAIRFPVFFALVSGYVFAGLLPEPRSTTQKRLAISFALVGCLASAFVLNFGNVSLKDTLGTFDHYRFSPLLVQQLADPSMHGNVFNEMEYGAELIYRAYPRLKPLIDCRFDSYSQDYLEYIAALKHDENLFEEFVARYDVRYLMMNSPEYKNYLKLPRSKTGRWRHYFNDYNIIILERVDQ